MNFLIQLYKRNGVKSTERTEVFPSQKTFDLKNAIVMTNLRNLIQNLAIANQKRLHE